MNVDAVALTCVDTLMGTQVCIETWLAVVSVSILSAAFILSLVSLFVALGACHRDRGDD